MRQIAWDTRFFATTRGRVLASDGTPLAANAPSTVVTVEPRTLLESPDEGRALVASVAQATGSWDLTWAVTAVLALAGIAVALVVSRRIPRAP